jgi:hypothetical protein
VNEEVAPYRGENESRVIVEGQDVFLKPALAQNLALCIHELATNAAKYGALSTNGGFVKLTWSVSANLLTLMWIEKGGPEVAPPERWGVGSRIIKTTVQAHMGGELSVDWHREGLMCIIKMPLENPLKTSIELGDRAGQIHKLDTESTDPIVLLVEDEPLIASMMFDLLREVGCRVLGPFNRVAEAAIALRENCIAGAVLDVSLGSELVFPLAELLHLKHIPFAFITGYDESFINEQYDDAVVLSKPIDKTILIRHLSEWASSQQRSVECAGSRC